MCAQAVTSFYGHGPASALTHAGAAAISMLSPAPGGLIDLHAPKRVEVQETLIRIEFPAPYAGAAAISVLSPALGGLIDLHAAK